MTRRNDPTPPRVNPWTLIAVFGGCAAAISIALFLAMAQRNAAIDEENNNSGQASRARPELIVSQPEAETIFQENREIKPQPVSLNHSDVLLPLPDGYRCIGKQMFHKLQNGFDQVTDGTASRYCGH